MALLLPKAGGTTSSTHLVTRERQKILVSWGCLQHLNFSPVLPEIFGQISHTLKAFASIANTVLPEYYLNWNPFALGVSKEGAGAIFPVHSCALCLLGDSTLKLVPQKIPKNSDCKETSPITILFHTKGWFRWRGGGEEVV